MGTLGRMALVYVWLEGVQLWKQSVLMWFEHCLCLWSQRVAR